MNNVRMRSALFALLLALTACTPKLEKVNTLLGDIFVMNKQTYPARMEIQIPQTAILDAKGVPVEKIESICILVRVKADYSTLHRLYQGSAAPPKDEVRESNGLNSISRSICTESASLIRNQLQQLVWDFKFSETRVHFVGDPHRTSSKRATALVSASFKRLATVDVLIRVERSRRIPLSKRFLYRNLHLPVDHLKRDFNTFETSIQVQMKRTDTTGESFDLISFIAKYKGEATVFLSLSGRQRFAFERNPAFIPEPFLNSNDYSLENEQISEDFSRF